MGTHASILYADKTISIQHDGDPGCVVEPIRSAFSEAYELSPDHKHRVVLSLLAEEFNANPDSSAWADSKEEWYYYIYAVNGVPNIEIRNYGKLKYEGPLMNAPTKFEDEEEE